ncbi:MAG: hypothetical protein R3218_09920 [Christiangramia sp.]|nr:hypothetical protein [Christiangramia sp.]
MGKWVKYWVLIIAIAGVSFGTYSQITPPPPQAQSQGNGRGPCGQLTSENPGGPRIPPPVGLCLPINDYLLPLLLVGIAFGGYKVWRIEKLSKSL